MRQCTGRRRAEHVPVRTLVHLLVEPLERAPAVKVVPEVVEPLDLCLGGVRCAERGDRLRFREAGIELEGRRERREEIEPLALRKSAL